ncbi:MAG: hypothetical protein ABJN39_07840 [Sulfitobacter sp.]|uniref:hypothetical protein n=1 Tax=Alphaproteobacteria TaxID=28211 RepID=UPI0029431158|nr:hypothetical protein [Sulfitobacter sp. LC.270.F.C4]WOI13266.1 hypothetical protein R1T45_01080 [Sulfitobacter sp. LC.270.F.C4]
MNVAQLLVSPIAKIADAETIKNLLASGDRSIAATRFGNCTAQLDYLTLNINDENLITLGGIRPVFGVEIFLLVTTFLIVFLVWHKGQNLIAERPSVFSIKWSVVIGLVLLAVDQVRYINTSVLLIDKNFFTWSSYCLQGDAAWAFDVIAYLPVYFGLGAAISIFCRGVARVDPDNASLNKNDIGLKSEYHLISGTMVWTSWISAGFFLIWVAGTGIGLSSSIFYASQAAIVFGLILILVIYSGYRAYQINVWYSAEFENKRLAVIGGAILDHGSGGVVRSRAA